MSRASQGLSFGFHVILLVLLLLLGMHPKAASVAVRPIVNLIYHPSPLKGTAGGGGGMHERLPARRGALPPPAPRVFVPPMQQVNLQPKLAMPVTIDAPPDTPTIASAIFGDPHGIGSLSAGTGGPAGIGDRVGRSIGPGSGDRYGPGADGVFDPGRGGVTMPVPIHTPEPEYADQARKMRLSGSVLVFAEINRDGKPQNLRILRGIGLGLDEKALEAVSRWIFRPGTKDGRPVTVRATFEVNFRLL